MNDNTYYKSCTKCGRPQTLCKGECCGKPQGCGCHEYGPKVCGCIRQVAPKCPYEAVIPSITVDTTENLKDLADCFVHVSDINTTFYIDDKHRILTTWAGPVEYDNYDLAANPLGLRSQFLIDFANERGAYYDKTGAYEIFNFGERDTPLRVKVVSYDTEAEWVAATLGSGYNINYVTDPGTGLPFGSIIIGMEVPSPVLQNMDTGETISPKEVYDAVASGREVKMYNLPFSWEYAAEGSVISSNFSPDSVGHVDGVSFSGISFDQYGLSPYAVGSAPSHFVGHLASIPAAAPLCFAITKEVNEGTGEYEYALAVQGLYTAVKPL